MSSLIEQAAHRLEQLRQAGITIPEPQQHVRVAEADAATAGPALFTEAPEPAAPADAGLLGGGWERRPPRSGRSRWRR